MCIRIKLEWWELFECVCERGHVHIFRENPKTALKRERERISPYVNWIGTRNSYLTLLRSEEWITRMKVRLHCSTLYSFLSHTDFNMRQNGHYRFLYLDRFTYTQLHPVLIDFRRRHVAVSVWHSHVRSLKKVMNECILCCLPCNFSPSFSVSVVQ